MNFKAENIIRFLLLGICLVAVATGLNVVLRGISGIPEAGLHSQVSVDNELRFMSVFWVAFGIYCFSISKNVYENRKSILFIALAFFFSGIARLLSYVILGKPIPLFVGAMVLELTLPFIIFALHQQMLRDKAKVPSH